MTRNSNKQLKTHATLRFLCWNMSALQLAVKALECIKMPCLVLSLTDCEAWAESIVGKGSFGRVHLSGVVKRKESTQGFPSDSTGGPPTCETGPSIHTETISWDIYFMPHTATIMSVKEKHKYVLRQSFITQQSILHPILPSKNTEKVRYTVGVSKPTLKRHTRLILVTTLVVLACFVTL